MRILPPAADLCFTRGRCDHASTEAMEGTVALLRQIVVGLDQTVIAEAGEALTQQVGVAAAEDHQHAIARLCRLGDAGADVDVAGVPTGDDGGAFARCGVDVILTGHLHRSHTSQSVERYRIAGHSALIMQAGTATSDRYRGELNAFNVLRIEPAKLSTHRFIWNAGRKAYEVQKEEAFTRHQDGWKAAEEADKK